MRQNLIDRDCHANLDEMISLYHRFQNGEKELEDKLQKLYFSLPNFSHPQTPVGDPSKYRVLHINGSPKNVSKPKKEVDLLSNERVSFRSKSTNRYKGLGLLRSQASMVAGCGPRAYAFYDELADLESALVQLALDRAKQAGFSLVSVPDILPATVIQRCGFPTTGERNQVFKIARPNNSSDMNTSSTGTFCLSGTAEMGLGGFCADRVFGEEGGDAEYFCAVSRCFRHEIAPQESLLYRTHQFTKVEMFCVSKPTPEVGDRIFDKVVEFQKTLFADLELHFRVLEMPTSELGSPAHRKIDIEALMPGEGIFGEISSASNCTDYQAIRLNIRWRENPNDTSPPYAYTLNGTGCAVTRILKALVETHQNADGTVEIPRILWPYMNDVRRLEPGDSPLVVL